MFTDKFGYLKKFLPFLVLGVLIYFPLFYHLDSLSVRLWDEGRRSVNAYEMMNNDRPIVNLYHGAPDLWNTKPPMITWLQALSMKVFGVNELALRLPSALAGLFTAVVILLFSIYYFNDFWFGFIAVLVLVTSQGYITTHGTRTGDIDALLTFFLTAGVLTFFRYVESDRRKFLYAFFVFLSLGVLTKGIAGLFFTPALVLYALYRKKFLPLLKNIHFYAGLLVFFIIAGGFYLLRERAVPGYLEAVWHNELGGRYLSTLEGNEGGFLYYYHLLVKSQFTYYIFLIPLGLIAGLINRELKWKRFTVFLIMLILQFFLLISFSKTKLRWYDVPLFPFLAMMAGVFIWWVFKHADVIRWKEKELRIKWFPYMVLALLFFFPYKNIIWLNDGKEKKPWNESFFYVTYYLRDASRGLHDLNNCYFLYHGTNPQNEFYMNIMKDNGIRIEEISLEDIRDGYRVITSQEEMQKLLNERYNTEIDSVDKNVIIYTVLGKKI